MELLDIGYLVIEFLQYCLVVNFYFLNAISYRFIYPVKPDGSASFVDKCKTL